jgi:hypothetical protein
MKSVLNLIGGSYTFVALFLSKAFNNCSLMCSPQSKIRIKLYFYHAYICSYLHAYMHKVQKTNSCLSQKGVCRPVSSQSGPTTASETNSRAQYSAKKKEDGRFGTRERTALRASNNIQGRIGEGECLGRSTSGSAE